MRSSKYIAAVVIAGFVLIGYLFYVSPSTAPGQLPAVLVAIGVLAKLFDTDAKVETVVEKVDTVETKVDNSVAVSEGNALALATVSEQTAHALETQAQQLADNTRVTVETQEGVAATHEMVDGQRTAMETKIGRLEDLVSALLRDRAVEASKQTQEGGLGRIADAIEAVVPAIQPPKEAGPDL